MSARYLVLRATDRFTMHVTRGPGVPGRYHAGGYSLRRRWTEGNFSAAGRTWDEALTGMLSSEELQFLSKTQPGLGNVLHALTSAVLLAIASGRILLVERWPIAAELFEGPIAELLLERVPSSVRALIGDDTSPADTSGGTAVQPGPPHGAPATRTSFITSDDAANSYAAIRGSDLLGINETVWRLYSNAYFANVLFRNSYHSKQLLKITSELLAWSNVVHWLWRPRRSLLRRARAYWERLNNSSLVIGVQMRQPMGSATAALLKECMRRLSLVELVRNASRGSHVPKRARDAAEDPVRGAQNAHDRAVVFLATPSASNRQWVAAALGPRLLPFEAVPRPQGWERDALGDAVVDLILLSWSHKLLLTLGSTFGDVARGLWMAHQPRAATEAGARGAFLWEGTKCHPPHPQPITYALLGLHNSCHHDCGLPASWPPYR